MTKTDLSPLKQTELRALVTLMVEGRSLTNRHLRDLAGTDLTGGRGERLKSLKLVTIEKIGRVNHYTLTDEGARALREPYASAPLDAVGRFVFTVLTRLQSGLDRRGISPGEFFLPTIVPDANQETSPAEAVDVKDRIRAAYAARPKIPGGWVFLAELRSDLSDLGRDEVDAALRELAGERGVRIAPLDNTKALRPEDKTAALQLGDSPKHMIAMGRA